MHNLARLSKASNWRLHSVAFLIKPAFKSACMTNLHSLRWYDEISLFDARVRVVVALILANWDYYRSADWPDVLVFVIRGSVTLVSRRVMRIILIFWGYVMLDVDVVWVSRLDLRRGQGWRFRWAVDGTSIELRDLIELVATFQVIDLFSSSSIVKRVLLIENHVSLGIDIFSLGVEGLVLRHSILCRSRLRSIVDMRHRSWFSQILLIFRVNWWCSYVYVAAFTALVSWLNSLVLTGLMMAI